MTKLIKFAVMFGIIFVLFGGFVFPALVIFLAMQILKFGWVIFVLDIACRMVFHRSLVRIISAGINEIKRNDDNYY